MEKTKVIGILRKAAIKAVLRLLERKVIDKIGYEPIKAELKKNLDFVEDTVDVLTDKNPQNLQQLKEVWEEHKPEALGAIEVSTKAGIRKLIKNQEEAEWIIDLIEGALEEQRGEPEVIGRVLTA